MTPTRRRGLLLLCFALVCGGLAAAQVHERERRAATALGPLVPVVVAQRDLPADRRLAPGDLAVRRVPARFAPPDALRGGVAGARTAVPVPAGGYLTAATLGSPGAGGEPRPPRPGERAIELAVAGGGALAAVAPGGRVDVLVTSGREEGRGHTFVALEDVELLGLRAGGRATLRVGARQAVYLTAAANFAEEVRLLVRPPGDHERIGTAAVAASGL